MSGQTWGPPGPVVGETFDAAKTGPSDSNRQLAGVVMAEVRGVTTLSSR